MNVQRWFVYRYNDGEIEYLYEDGYDAPMWSNYAPKLYLTNQRAASMAVICGGTVGLCMLRVEDEE